MNRLSRHLYDVYQMSKQGISASAFNDHELYETIVAHRHKYAKVSHVDYNLHNPKTLNPIPIEKVIKAWAEDYSQLKEDMIYEEAKPSFKDLIDNLEELREKLQNTEWIFGLKFSR